MALHAPKKGNKEERGGLQGVAAWGSSEKKKKSLDGRSSKAQEAYINFKCMPPHSILIINVLKEKAF